MTTEHYPICKVPYDIESVSMSKPMLPSKPIEPQKSIPPEPRKPYHLREKEEKNSNTSCIGIFFGVAVFVGFHWLLISAGLAGAVWVWVLYGLVFFALIYVLFSKDRQKEKERNLLEEQLYYKELQEYPLKVKNAEEKYKLDLQRFSYELNKYNQIVNELSTPRAIAEHRRQQKINFFSKALKPIETTETYRQGVSEDFFLDYLTKYFGKYIKTDTSIKDDNWFKDRLYNPDFIFYDPETIAIDIEIDEPYIGQTGEPIHFIGSHEARDDFFTQNNWLVIRFAEEQIIKEPENCCYFIAEKIIEYTENETFINKLKGFTQPKHIRQWTKEEAHKLAFSRYRNSYLDLEFNEMLQDQINRSITFADVEPVKNLGRVVTHRIGDRVYGISHRRLDQSSCKDDVVLYVSNDGKWLIPADTV